MKSLRPVFGVIQALVPILYCGGLIYYFVDSSGSLHDAQTVGLGPTLLGLGAAGLFFCVLLVAKIIWIFALSRSPGLGGGSDVSTADDTFDADAMIGRHMAQRTSEIASELAAAPSGHNAGVPAKRPTFGRARRFVAPP